MRVRTTAIVCFLALFFGFLTSAWAQAQPAAGQASAGASAQAAPADDPVRTLVGRLDLEKYKATIKGLTKFGDRRQGTDRSRAATDWIEAQLKSYGCAPTERITYDYQPAQRAATGTAAAGAAAGGARGQAGAAQAGAAQTGARGATGGAAAAAGRGAQAPGRPARRRQGRAAVRGSRATARRPASTTTR